MPAVVLLRAAESVNVQPARVRDMRPDDPGTDVVMFRRYTHGHSIGVGVLIGLLLAQHVLMLVLVAALLGVAVGRSWAWVVAFLRVVWARVAGRV